jgi:nucleoside-diphosphate-sugar epimerase
MKIRWITPTLGTAAATEVIDAADVSVIDVRDLVDKAGNRSEAILEKISAGVASIRQGRRTVVCCDFGMSRSNAVAAGVLARLEDIPFDVAVRRVREATGEEQIKVEPIAAVRAALREEVGSAATSGPPSLLITGGASFLGRTLVAAANSRFRVRAPTGAQLDLNGGGTELDLLVSESGATCVVHLATPRVLTSNAAVGECLTQLRNVIDVCIVRDVRLVYLSSWEIYSGYAGALLAGESTPALPRGPYGESQYLAETLIEHHRRASGLRCALLRSSPEYGAGADRPKFIYNFLEKALRNQRIVTHRYRNGSPALDLLHVDDLVAAMVRALELGFEGTLNLGTGVVTSTPDIARMICAQVGSSSEVTHSEIDGCVASIAMNAGRAQAVLGWKPRIPFSEGLAGLLRGLNPNEVNNGV